MIDLPNLMKHFQNQKLKLKVIPNASKTELVEDEAHQLKLYLQAVPDKNKANLELLKFFKKNYNLHLEFVSGLKSREKILKIKN